MAATRGTADAEPPLIRATPSLLEIRPMGQQQLLLLVLGIVLVGLAVVVGIQAFEENQKKANADAMVNDGIRLATAAQAWALKPSAFGGPAAGENLGHVTYADLGYEVNDDGDYVSLNGTYELQGMPWAGGAIFIGTSRNGEGNTVYVQVCGTDPEDISTVVNGPRQQNCS